jgi:hypothetical protein
MERAAAVASGSVLQGGACDADISVPGYAGVRLQ